MPLNGDIVKTITDQLVQSGQIPEKYRQTFEEGLEADMQRAVLRYRHNLVDMVVRSTTQRSQLAA